MARCRSMPASLPGGEGFAPVAASLLASAAPRQWARATETERKRLLRGSFDALRQVWHLSSQLQFAELDDDYIGSYDPESDIISLDVGLLADADITEPLSTLVHESRHALQQRAMQKAADHPLGAVEGADEVSVWKNAAATYDDDSASLTQYAYNALETDAATVERAVLVEYWKAAYLRFRRRLWNSR